MLSEQTMAHLGPQPQFAWLLYMTFSPSSVKLNSAQLSTVTSLSLFRQPKLSSSVRVSLLCLTTQIFPSRPAVYGTGCACVVPAVSNSPESHAVVVSFMVGASRPGC